MFDALHRLHLIEPVTQTNADELACIERYSNRKRTAVEIGTFMGVSAALIARNLAPGGSLYCVDPYDGGEALRRIAWRHFARAGVADRIKPVRAYSAEAIRHLPPAVDFVFVDGDHSYAGLATDWQIVRQVLAPGGVACFHDTTLPAGIPCGARDFFEESIRGASGFEHVETCHSLNVMRRHA